MCKVSKNFLTSDSVDDEGRIIVERLLLELEFVDAAEAILVEEPLDGLHHILLRLSSPATERSEGKRRERGRWGEGKEVTRDEIIDQKSCVEKRGRSGGRPQITSL